MMLGALCRNQAADVPPVQLLSDFCSHQPHNFLPYGESVKTLCSTGTVGKNRLSVTICECQMIPRFSGKIKTEKKP